MQRAVLTGQWLPQFGEVVIEAPDEVVVTATSPVGPKFHAESHHGGVLGADFRYSAVLEGDWTASGLCGDLQFRISDEARYGVRVQAGAVTLYRFILPHRACGQDPSVVAHCPLWADGHGAADDPIETTLGTGHFMPFAGPIEVAVESSGSLLSVSFASVGAGPGGFVADDDALGIGRFGLYVLSDEGGAHVAFRDLTATADPTAASNFAVLHSTAGYDVAGRRSLRRANVARRSREVPRGHRGRRRPSGSRPFLSATWFDRRRPPDPGRAP